MDPEGYTIQRKQNGTADGQWRQRRPFALWPGGVKIRILTNSTKTRRERERETSCVLHLALKFYCSVRVCQVRLLKKNKKQLPEPVVARRFVRLRVLGVLHWCVRLYLGVHVGVRESLARDEREQSELVGPIGAGSPHNPLWPSSRLPTNCKTCKSTTTSGKGFACSVAPRWNLPCADGLGISHVLPFH